MDANTKSKVKAFHEKMEACAASRRDDREVTVSCQEKMEPNSGEKEAVVERQKIPNVEVAIHSLRACRSETAASQEATETEPDTGTMQSVEEHQEIPKEEAAVMPIGRLRKRRRDRNLAVGRLQKLKGRIQASCESRRRLTVAGKKMTCHATVAWRKRNMFRKFVTQGMCRPRKRLTTARIKMTCHARVAWRRENCVRKDWTTGKVEQEARRAWMLRRRLQLRQKNGKGIRDLGGRLPLYRRKRRPTKNGIGRCKSGHRSPLGSRGTQKKAIYEIVSMNIMQQITEIFRNTRRLEVAK
jgi:hypothetical protein